PLTPAQNRVKCPPQPNLQPKPKENPMVVIRLARGGAKKRPFYNIVVTDSRRRRDSGYIERIGYFNPRALTSETRFEIDSERLDYWRGQGVKLSDRVTSLVKSGGARKPKPAKPEKAALAKSETPAASAEPDKAASPEASAAPEDSATQEASSEDSDKQEASAKPEAPAASEDSTKQEASATKEASAEPEDSAKQESPAEPESSAETPTPETPETPDSPKPS
ncbi:MAG: 30S ribosomal protein S16, partial [Gammaproteobacteria bacterium]|nr:30S ribosomal protein S16 [Gammaproteobacteria bacterium]